MTLSVHRALRSEVLCPPLTLSHFLFSQHHELIKGTHHLCCVSFVTEGGGLPCLSLCHAGLWHNLISYRCDRLWGLSLGRDSSKGQRPHLVGSYCVLGDMSSVPRAGQFPLHARGN